VRDLEQAHVRLGGVPKASAATADGTACASPVGSASEVCSTAIHQPAHWNCTGSAIGTRPAPRWASQPRQAPSAWGRSPAGSGSSVSGTSVTEARQAAKPRASALAPDAVGSSTSITAGSRR
jgi:hypothetical protein